MEDEKRIVVCSNCGILYDIHFIDDVSERKGVIVGFWCKVCNKMMPVIYKDFSRGNGG
jgi:hypothetical protein